LLLPCFYCFWSLFSYNINWNHGSFPQSWEDPSFAFNESWRGIWRFMILVQPCLTYICDSDINIALITKRNTCLMTHFDFSWCCCDWRGGAQLENSCNFLWWPRSFPCQWCWKTFSSNTCLFSSSIMYLLTKITHTRCCLLVMSEFEAKTIWDYISVLNTTKLFCKYTIISICIVVVLIIVWNRKVSYLLPWAIWSWTTLDLAVLDCNTCM